MMIKTGTRSGKRPQQRVAEVLTGLGVGRHAAGVVVADHDDEPGTNDGEQGEEAGARATAIAFVVRFDGAEGTRNGRLFRLFALHAPPPFVCRGRSAKQPRKDQRG